VSISERNDVSKVSRPAQRLEIFTGAGRRRAWMAEQKAAIVAESLEDGAPVSQNARRHGLTPQQVFAWRRQGPQRQRRSRVRCRRSQRGFAAR
jgi:transposase